ncbi:glycosyltransferase [Parabacteroides pacaensis]|uniref:glycosyltransferase n=1 Tax=Parabacteroides pacaensis TaxID=2086575 RepID=UPI000D0ECB52|nr:glycosyltransferase [Parabacteroides pacaensis]
MRILLVNKFYYPRGGDCISTLNLEELLKKYGHEVAVFAMDHPETIDTPYKKYFPSEISFSLSSGNLLESFMRPFGTSEVKKKFTSLLNDFRPDIVHLNNIHTQLSPIVAEIAYKRGIKVFWTLHDYKLLCPRYDCLCQGKDTCELCYTDKQYVLKYKCMKGSLIASMIAYQEALKWSRCKLEKYTHKFICPSRFMASRMERGGYNKDKIVSLSNFIDAQKCVVEGYFKEDYYCYVGRLSPEKGIDTLIESAKQLPYKLKIIGTGPLFDRYKYLKNHSIEFLGYQPWPVIKKIVNKARFMVIPSECYENNPLSILESLCLGTPVLGSEIGGIPELIEENYSGLLFCPNNVEHLKNKIQEMFKKEFVYQDIAFKSQERYSSGNYYLQLMKLYKQ